MANTTSAASICCVALSGIFAGKVFQPGSDAYASSLASYFSLQQSEVTPRCLFVPETSQDVSLALGALTSASTAHHSCDFAVRSGGFSYYAGASNIADGVTIDLRQLSHIDLRSDHSLVSVGPGATWASVYAYLDPLNLTVAGGRDADVGVGGLTLSGGISYLGPRYGWACDTVQDFEIVLANATILHANHRENANLFWALRGGSNNFGIVTSISFRPVELESGLLWGGFIEYDASTADEQIAAFVNFSQPETYDEYSSLITTFSYASAIHGSILSTNLEYTRPVVNPPVFQAISSIPSLTSTMRVTNMTDLSAESQKLQAAGSRSASATLTIRPTVEALNAAVRAWSESVESIRNVSGIVWSVVFDPLPPQLYARNAGDNALGFAETDEHALAILLVSVTWPEEGDDSLVQGSVKSLTAGLATELRELGALHPFVYLNYAAPWQDPIASYGNASMTRLEKVRQQYDPAKVFTDQVPGGFKVKA